MRAIQHHLPNPRLTELHRITVQAPPEIAWEVARHFDMAKIPWIRLLFDIRTLPSRIRGKEPADRDRRLGIDQITANETGFDVLEEKPGREVVVGAIGAFWKPVIPFANVAPTRFAAFDTPGFGKLAWAFRVEPFATGSLITLELRATATDDESWRKQTRYFRFIGPASYRIRSSVMAHLEDELGSLPRPADKARALPGDEIIPDAHVTFTHGIDIEAPPSLVWRYLMQLGCDRGGWYSIDALDNAGIPSVEYLVPEWETRRAGDQIAATPRQEGGFDVLAAEPEELLVLGAEADRLGGHVQTSWAFVPELLGRDATHLVTRVRARGTPRWSEWLQGQIYQPVHAVMQRTQLHNLKRVAELEAQAR